MASTFIKRQSSKAFSGETETYIKRFYHKVKSRLTRMLAPILNHPNFDKALSTIIDLLFTGAVIGLVIWLVQKENPLLRGFGIAVTIALTQYYIKWYYKVKK